MVFSEIVVDVAYDDDDVRFIIIYRMCMLKMFGNYL